MEFLDTLLPAAYRRRVLLNVQLISIVALLLGLVVVSLVYTLYIRLVLLTAVVLVALGWWAARRGQEKLGAYLLIGTLLVLATVLACMGQGINDIAYQTLPALLILGGLILPLRHYFVVIALVVFSVLLVATATSVELIRPTAVFPGLPAIWGETASLLVIFLSEAVMVLVLVSGALRFFSESEQKQQALQQAHEAIRKENDERQRAELAVRHLNAELEQRVAARTADLQRLIDELDAFNYSVSHDLRAPLRAINGFSMAAADELPADASEAKRYLDKVQSASRRMNALIDDLLRLSKTSTQTLQTRTIAVEHLLAELVADLPENERAVVDIELLSEPATVAADAGLLRVALNNLLSNAIKYCRDQTPPHVQIHFEIGSESVLVHIRDNGIGFPAADTGRLFKAFSRLENAKGFDGTGIGLAIVRRIVERHHGRVWAQSEPGKGACFSLALPRYASNRESDTDSTLPAAASASV